MNATNMINCYARTTQQFLIQQPYPKLSIYTYLYCRSGCYLYCLMDTHPERPGIIVIPFTIIYLSKAKSKQRREG